MGGFGTAVSRVRLSKSRCWFVTGGYLSTHYLTQDLESDRTIGQDPDTSRPVVQVPHSATPSWFRDGPLPQINGHGIYTIRRVSVPRAAKGLLERASAPNRPGRGGFLLRLSAMHGILGEWVTQARGPSSVLTPRPAPRLPNIGSALHEM